jgi:hypothetical protein
MAVPYTPNKRLYAGYVRCTDKKVAVNAQLAGLPMKILVILALQGRSSLSSDKPGNRGTISGDPGCNHGVPKSAIG